MQRMVTAPIPLYSPNDITRVQSRAGGWIASFDFDVASTSTPSQPIIASPNESLDDSSITTSILTGPFCCNHQYSVTAITTSTGAIAERYAYTAYGQPTILNASGTPLSPQTSTLNSRYSYTGREWDATLGLHHFRARWMSPSAGRFLGRDPIGYRDYINAYRANFGLAKQDPTGKITEQDCRQKRPIAPPSYTEIRELVFGHSIIGTQESWWSERTTCDISYRSLGDYFLENCFGSKDPKAPDTLSIVWTATLGIQVTGTLTFSVGGLTVGVTPMHSFTETKTFSSTLGVPKCTFRKVAVFQKIRKCNRYGRGNYWIDGVFWDTEGDFSFSESWTEYSTSFETVDVCGGPLTCGCCNNGVPL
jgi:RHS repeat-associated protein